MAVLHNLAPHLVTKMAATNVKMAAVLTEMAAVDLDLDLDLVLNMAPKKTTKMAAGRVVCFTAI